MRRLSLLLQRLFAIGTVVWVPIYLSYYLWRQTIIDVWHSLRTVRMDDFTQATVATGLLVVLVYLLGKLGWPRATAYDRVLPAFFERLAAFAEAAYVLLEPLLKPFWRLIVWVALFLWRPIAWVGRLLWYFLEWLTGVLVSAVEWCLRRLPRPRPRTIRPKRQYWGHDDEDDEYHRRSDEIAERLTEKAQGWSDRVLSLGVWIFGAAQAVSLLHGNHPSLLDVLWRLVAIVAGAALLGAELRHIAAVLLLGVWLDYLYLIGEPQQQITAKAVVVMGALIVLRFWYLWQRHIDPGARPATE